MRANEEWGKLQRDQVFLRLEFALSGMFRFRLEAPAIRRILAQKDVYFCRRCTATAPTSSVRGNAAQAQAGTIEKQREQRILHIVEQRVAYKHRLEREARLLAPSKETTNLCVQHSPQTKNSMQV